MLLMKFKIKDHSVSNALQNNTRKHLTIYYYQNMVYNNLQYYLSYIIPESDFSQ